MDKHIHRLMLIICFSSVLIQSKSHESKVTRLHFYLQDIVGGENRTAWDVAASNLTGVLPSQFGRVLVLDNLATAGPGLDSPEVGRLQGTVALADLRQPALTMVLNLVLTTGEFAGSTLSFLGRNPLGDEVREVSIVGGTGAFRMATGYVLITTYFSDPALVRNVYEYSPVVYHHVHG